MPTVTMDVFMVPLGGETTSMSSFVAACHRVLENYPNIRYHVNPMSTTLEGELDILLTVVRAMLEAPFETDKLNIHRVSTTIRIDDRRDKPTSIEQKLQSIEQKLSSIP